jgi:hypothetical protein
LGLQNSVEDVSKVKNHIDIGFIDELYSSIAESEVLMNGQQIFCFLLKQSIVAGQLLIHAFNKKEQE